MRRSALPVYALLILSLWPYPCQAGDRVGLGVKVGTLGLGADLTGRITSWFAVRGTVNAVDVSGTYEDTDIDYDADAEIGAYGLLLDFHPFKNNFRITAGMMKNRNAFQIVAAPTADVDIGDGTYTPAQVGTLDGDVSFKDSAAYFGIGYGFAPMGPSRVKFVLDVGVMDQGAGEVSMTSSTGLVADSDLRQEEQEIEDDISDYDLWPVIAFGISFRF